MGKDEAGANALKEIAFYYPNPMWMDDVWVKNLVLFFDGIGLLVSNYMKERIEQIDPAIVEGLRRHDLLHIISPEVAVNKSATNQLTDAMGEIIATGVLDKFENEQSSFHEISMPRLGYFGDDKLAKKLVKKLKKRGLARDTEDGVSIPVHRHVRSLVLVLLAQILRPYGKTMNAELSPATDNPLLVKSLIDLLKTRPSPTAADVVSFDLNTVGVDLGAVPIDEVLDFRRKNLSLHRKYCVAIRLFAAELSRMEREEQILAFESRQSELDEMAQEVRRRSRIAWKQPAAFGLTLTGCAYTGATGDPVGALIALLGGLLQLETTEKGGLGAFTYIFSAQSRFPY